MANNGNNQEIDELLKKVIDEARSIDIPISHSISPKVLINPRPKRRLGCCKKQGRKFVVEISSFVLDADLKVIKGVLAHEILHTCRGSYEHGKIWKSYGKMMNETYGYDIKRVTSFAEMGLPEIAEIDNRVKYIIRCQKCGREYPRQKFTCVMKKIHAYRCNCGGKLEWKKIDRIKGDK